METWLIAAEDSALVERVQDCLDRNSAEIKLLSASTAEEGWKILLSADLDRLVTTTSGPGIDRLIFIAASMTTNPGLDVCVIADRNESAIDGDATRGGLRFFGSVEQAVSARGNTELKRKNLDIINVVHLARMAGQSRLLEVRSPQDEGVLGFVDGILVHASTGNYSGEEAFLQMALWDETSVRPLDQDAAGPRDANIDLSAAELIAETVSLNQLLEYPKADDRGADAGNARPMRSLVDALLERAQKVFETRKIAKIMVAFDNGHPCQCAASLTRSIASQMPPDKEWASAPGEEPAFVRLHCPRGDVMSLTFLPMSAKNRFYFETFANTSDVVVICTAEANTSDLKSWWNVVPDQVQCMTATCQDSNDADECAAFCISQEAVR